MKIRFSILCLLMSTLLSCDEERDLKDDFGSYFATSPEYEESPSNLSELVNSVCFIDDKNGFAAGNGKIFKTTNGGQTWESDSITNLPFMSIYFVDSNIGFAVGGQSGCGGTNCTVPGSIVYKTIDSGASWNKLDVPYEWSELNSVFFIDENIGFATGLGLHIKTNNGGQTWRQFEFDYPVLMKKIHFIDTQTGFSAGLFGNIFKTTNQGVNWIKTNNESDGHIYDFYFVNENIGFAGGQKEIVGTTDGGQTWHIIKDSPMEIYFLHFSDEKNGFAIGRGHYTGGDWGTWTTAIFRTHDGGITWAKEDNVKLSSVASFYDHNNGYSIAPDKTFSIHYK